MANIVITTTTNAVKLVFNDQTWFKIMRETISKNDIAEVECVSNAVVLVLDDGHRMSFTHDATNTEDSIGIVDSVDAVAPTSLVDLYNKLSVIIE